MKNLFLVPLLLAGCMAATFRGDSETPSTVINIAPSDWELAGGSVVTQLPDGTAVMEAGYGSTFSRDLGVTPVQLQASITHPGYFVDGVYQITFSVENNLPPYPAYYTGEVSFGTQELCPFEGWIVRTFTQVTVVCPGPAYIVADKALPGGGPVQGEKDLVIRGSVPGWPAYFKNFSFVFTPGGG